MGTLSTVVSSSLPLCAMGTAQNRMCLFHRTVPICTAPHSPFITWDTSVSASSPQRGSWVQQDKSTERTTCGWETFHTSGTLWKKSAHHTSPQAHAISRRFHLWDNNSSSKSDGNRKTIGINISACLVITQHQCLKSLNTYTTLWALL